MNYCVSSFANHLDLFTNKCDKLDRFNGNRAIQLKQQQHYTYNVGQKTPSTAIAISHVLSHHATLFYTGQVIYKITIGC